jgi:hypothetical protein
MISLHHFNEAHRHYQDGLIPFRLLQDQAAVMIGICRIPHPGVINALDISESDIQWLLQQEEAGEDYSDFLGGYVHVCETEADLKEINGCDLQWAEAQGGRWPNVTDIPMSWDNCGYLDEPSGDPQWVIFLLCWNDAGGPVYYVPKHIWLAARVAEHINETDRAWNP